MLYNILKQKGDTVMPPKPKFSREDIINIENGYVTIKDNEKLISIFKGVAIWKKIKLVQKLN